MLYVRTVIEVLIWRDLSRRAVCGEEVGERKNEHGDDESLRFYGVKKPIPT